MRSATGRWAAVTLAVALGLLTAACGGGDATSTPPPATPTATKPPPTPTSTPLPPTPTPTPVGGAVPTAVVTQQGKRGGVLQLIALPTQPYGFDTYEAGSPSFSYEVWNPIFNNLIWPDPYARGQALVGDAAETWTVSGDGTVITLSLRRGITFHDGKPLTAADVVYNLDRGVLHPRTPTMVFFKARLSALKSIEALDDYTVRLTLAAPTNSALRVLGMNQMSLYPAHIPFPDKLSEFQQKPIGSGPFKVKSLDKGVRLEWTRNDAYWKPALPFLDGIVYTPASGETSVAAFRTGRADATLFNNNDILPSIVTTLKRETGFVAGLLTISVNQAILNNRAPFTDGRVREAISLAIDRQALVDTWQQGAGNPYAAPLLAPELGGQWGISVESMKTRPGFRDNKTEDLARAKQLVTDARVSETTLNIMTSLSFRVYGEVVDASLRAVGIKAKLDLLDPAETNARLQRGDFDIYLISASINIDDPSDTLADFVVTGAGQNRGKWSWPELDTLMTTQDRTLDVAKRKAILADIQEMVLRERYGAFIPTIVRESPVGHQPWVKNTPSNLPFLHSPWYRWEQVWIER